MTIPSRSSLLKIYVGEKIFSRGVPIYEEILWEARKMGLAGCTITKCEMGYGHIGVTQSRENEKNDDLPVLIEVVDSPEKVAHFAAVVEKRLGNHGLILMSDVAVLHQGFSSNNPVHR